MGYSSNDGGVGWPAACGTSAGKRTITVTDARERRRQADPKERALLEELLKKLQELPDVRQDLIDRVKREIAEGAYETPERIEKAVDGLMRELFEDGGPGDATVKE